MIKAYRLRICLFVIVAVLACVNALAPWGDEVARRGEVILQLGTGLGAVACGLAVAMRVSGAARWWRLLLSMALVAFLVGQVLWWTGNAAVEGELVAPAVLLTYLASPAFALASMYVLLRSTGGVFGQLNIPLRQSATTTLLDGAVAAGSFLIFISMGGFGVHSKFSLPRSVDPAVEFVFSLAELLVVVVAVVITMIYRPDRPYRANYLLFAAGIVTMASADRLIAYYEFVGAANSQRWAAIGFVLGPLMLAYAMLRPQSQAVEAGRQGHPMDWAQLLLPYLGFLGIAVLFAFHVSFGRQITDFVIMVALLMALLIAIRQVAALHAQLLLTQRLSSTQRDLARQVHTDALTGLPNRLLFGQRLGAAMRDGRFVLIFVDLDDFKDVNDRYGHAAGDDLLRAVGERLRRSVTEADTLARVGGDEFAILIEGSREEPEVVADRLRVALQPPFAVQGSSVRVRASMGLVRPSAGILSQTPDDLLRQADISMYAGKRIGKDTAVVYQPSSDTRGDFPTALRQADGGVPVGFSLVYQPIVRLPDGVPVAVEALARWSAPNGIDISPETFVAAAEAAGLGAALDALVLDLGCSEVQASGLDVDLHVNVGAARLGNPSFEQQVRDTLARHRVEPSRLVLEITETVPIVDLAEAADQIKRLTTLGIKVALDDFGVRFNSLMYLHSLPVQVVKLDRRFVSGTDLELDRALYGSIVRLCGDLGMDVIVEGIEHASQAGAVYEVGCRLAQGHLFGSAAPISELSSGSEAQHAPA
ncbi:GGDEF-domain containing protein [Mycolicibacterium cyprinidarum]|uniref:GGDEF-domain containing protein n=1 Tax=Mycolicibacterium cyprinidarum TaxID=2860311 RepID=A0ABQ4V620_9MYCO|nr:GGDEF-domain containing protein [Mycolicibacterium sp. NGTWS0302]GJF10152.1 GGDEF-domain containing protein [Mycolicibacterium sp. NGTWSNA01]